MLTPILHIQTSGSGLLAQNCLKTLEAHFKRISPKQGKQIIGFIVIGFGCGPRQKLEKRQDLSWNEMNVVAAICDWYLASVLGGNLWLLGQDQSGEMQSEVLNFEVQSSTSSISGPGGCAFPASLCRPHTEQVAWNYCWVESWVHQASRFFWQGRKSQQFWPKQVSDHINNADRNLPQNSCDLCLRWEIASDCDSACDFLGKMSPLRFGWRGEHLQQKIAAVWECEFWCSQVGKRKSIIFPEDTFLTN